MLMCAPEVSGQFTSNHADFEINGMFCACDCGPFCKTDAQAHGLAEVDYIDLDIDTAIAGVPADFGGVSGGGLWNVFLYRDGSTDKWLRVFVGTAFHQSLPANGHRIIRCHAAQSVGVAMSFLP
jgi:hypothetical protein